MQPVRSLTLALVIVLTGSLSPTTAAADTPRSIGHTAFLGAGLSLDSAPGGGTGLSTAALMYLDPRAGGPVSRMYVRASLSNAAGISAAFGFRLVRGVTLGGRLDRFEIGVDGETGQRLHELLGGELGWIAVQSHRLVLHPVLFVQRGEISGNPGARRVGAEITALAPVFTYMTVSGTPWRLALYASLGGGQSRLAGATAATDVETSQVYLTSGVLLVDL